MTRTNIIKIDEFNNGKYTRNSKNTTSKPFFHSSTNKNSYVGAAAYVSYDYYNHNGGGGNMDNYITRPEFEEHKRHLDSRFDGIAKDIKLAKNEIIKNIEDDRKSEDKERAQERKSDRKWFVSLSVGTGIALLGLILQAFNVI